MNAIQRSIAEVLVNSDCCSLKCLAWAYGCAAKGSDLERQLESALRIRASAPSPVSPGSQNEEHW